MDLWIRSQDRKSIVKPIDILLENPLNSGETGIRGYFSNNSYKMLGIYKTKQRALEVLDEITNLIKPKYLIRMDNHGPVNDFLNNENNSYVSAEGVGMVSNINQTLYYEMPKE